MPMIDIYAAAGTFGDTHQLAADAAATVMRVEQVPDIPMFRQNTAAFVHELPAWSPPRPPSPAWPPAPGSC
jgi:hypothetical protein